MVRGLLVILTEGTITQNWRRVLIPYPFSIRGEEAGVIWHQRHRHHAMFLHVSSNKAALRLWTANYSALVIYDILLD